MNRRHHFACCSTLLCLLVAATAPVAAQVPHGYAGLSLGQASGDFDAPSLLLRQLPLGSALGAVSQDRSAGAVKLFGGYRFNSYWSLEGGYMRLGDLGIRGVASPAGALAGRIKLQGLNLDVVGFMPLVDQLALTARVGGIYGRTEIDYQGEGSVVPRHSSVSRSTGSLKLGVGLQYALSPTLTLRLDAERYRFDDVAVGHGIVKVYTVGLQTPTN